MHEIRCGVIADAAGAERNGRLAKIGQFTTRQLDVDRLRFHMQAAFGDAARTGCQHAVAGRGTVAGNDVERLFAVQITVQHMHHVEQPDVHRRRLVGAVIAQDAVEFGNRFGQVAPVLPVERTQALAGVVVIER